MGKKGRAVLQGYTTLVYNEPAAKKTRQCEIQPHRSFVTPNSLIISANRHPAALFTLKRLYKVDFRNIILIYRANNGIRRLAVHLRPMRNYKKISIQGHSRRWCCSIWLRLLWWRAEAIITRRLIDEEQKDNTHFGRIKAVSFKVSHRCWERERATPKTASVGPETTI